MNKITYLCFVMLFSVFFTSQPKAKAQTSTAIQRVRINFTTPTGYVRHLLLGFTPNNAATDGVDYGYDALNIDDYPDDMNWLINNDRYVIQGVGAFDTSKYYPLGLFLTNSGSISIALDALENFENPIDVYVYDATLNTYTSINDSNYSSTVESGTQLNRYYIAFTNIPPANIGENSLAIADATLQDISISYLKYSKTLSIDTKNIIDLKHIALYNLQGQRLLDLGNLTQNRIEIAMNYMLNTPVILHIQAVDGQVLNKKLLLQ